eukprot:487553-Amphidinium_carterae.1
MARGSGAHSFAPAGVTFGVSLAHAHMTGSTHVRTAWPMQKSCRAWHGARAARRHDSKRGCLAWSCARDLFKCRWRLDGCPASD